MEIHNNKIPGRESVSLRHKYTSTHRRKVPTEDPECPLEVRETTLVKLAIGNKAELANYDKEYDMEVDSYEPEESDGVVARVKYIASSDTYMSLSPCHRGLYVWARKPDKLYLMGLLVMQMMHDEAARKGD